MPANVAGLKNPYDVLWDPANKGKIAVIDDWHTAMSMVLLRQGHHGREHLVGGRPEGGR